MTFAVPLKVTFRLFVYDKDPETGARMMRDAKEEEVYFGDIPLMTRQRHVHHQRHRARHRLAAPPQPGRVLHQGRPAHLPVEDHSVPRLVGRVRVRPEGRAVGAHRPQAQVPRHGVPARPGPARPTSRSCASSTAAVGAARPHGEGKLHADRSGQGARAGAPARPPEPRPPRDLPGLRRHHALEGAWSASSSKGKTPRGPGQALRSRSRVLRSPTWSTSTPARCCSRPTTCVPQDIEERLQGPQPHAARGLLPGLGADRQRSLSNTLAKDNTTQLQGGADRDLPPHASGRPSDPGERAVAVLRHVLRRQALRLLARRPVQVQHQARHRGAGRPEDAVGGRLLPRHRVPAAPAQGRRPRRRHRQPRQPPRARGGRAAREPVPHRPRPHGARDQGEDVRPPGHRLGDAARPDQLQAGHRGDQGVLRFVAAVAVHGPDQPALRGHPQAPACRPSDRAVCRASAPASKCATSTPRTTAASARSRRRKARTSA